MKKKKTYENVTMILGGLAGMLIGIAYELGEKCASSSEIEKNN